MRALAIRAANRAHRHPSAWVRRPAIIAAVTALVVLEIGYWLLLPAMILLLTVLEAGEAFFGAIGNLPAEFRQRARDWTINLSGAARIWRSQKYTPALTKEPRND
jgi:hypothetical protein